jgi:putative aldouronate transport system substrate-binding protein
MRRPAKSLKWLNVIGTFALATSVMAGCSTDAKPEKKSAASAKTQQLTKIDIMVNLQTPVVPSDKIEKLIEQKTGVDINFQWVPDGTYDEKFQVAFATNALPQAAYIKNQASFVQLREAIKSGQFWEISPYLKDYPNLSKLNKEILNNTAVDGKIYSLYKERPLARQGIIYRKDWADKLGLQAPKTTEDIYTMLKKFKEAQLGGPNGVPLADRNDLIYGSFKTLSSYFGTPNGWGVEDNKLVPEFATKGYIDTMKFVKKLRDEGLINQDFPVTSKTDQQNMMYTGTSGMYIGALTDAGVIQDKTSKNIKEAQYDVANQIAGPSGKPGIWALPGYGTLVMFPKSIVKTEDEMKQILAFFDKWFDKDIVNLLKYGIEGEHYTLKDGKVVPMSDTKLLEKDVKPYSTLALTDSMNVLPLFYNIPVEEKGFKLSDEAVNFAISDPTVPLNSPTFNERGARLSDIIKDATYKFILGKIDESGYQAELKKWKDEGGAKIIEEYNAAYKGGK